MHLHPVVKEERAVNVRAKIDLIEKKYLRSDLPVFNVGDTIKMKIKVMEADKMRLHPFEGTVILKKGRGVGASFTVRKMSFGEGIEKTFPLNSPVIDSIQVVSRGKVKRAKIFYLRGKVGKGTKIKLKDPAQNQEVKVTA